ncbi:MAG TPA: nitroreductase family protein [Sedimentisphaerales bacterium]|nr:nitroreductase family protein [Sedimentisphaerales bacterium]
MNRRTFLKTLPAFTVLAGSASSSAENPQQNRPAKPLTEGDKSMPAGTTPGSARDLQPITLLKPQTDGGKSVLAALRERRTNRKIKADKLPPQVLSNLLWAAFGVNREKAPFGKQGRTAPSASNSQEIDLYVVLPEGVYLYEAVPHRLTPIVSGDFRARSGRGAATTAAVNIFYVVDLTRYDSGKGQPDRRIGDPEVQKSYYYTATGLIAENVYLFAASQGLAAWFHNCDKKNTADEFKLRPEQHVLFAQTVGYPA